MTETRYRGLLEPVGISGAVETVYLTLLASPSSTAADLARAAGVPASVARSALEALETEGLVVRTPGTLARFVVAPPDVAIEGLIVRRQESLRTLRTAVTDLGEAYRMARGTTAAELVEVVTGARATTLRFVQLQASAEREVVSFCRLPLLHNDNDVQMPAMVRGVSYRTVYDRDVLATPGLLDVAAVFVSSGEQARSCVNLPVKMVIADSRTALVTVIPDSQSSPAGALVVHGSGLLDALAALFEIYWRAGTPLRFDRSSQDTPLTTDEPPSSHDLRLLSLLLAGVTDSAIAAQLHISERTVWRRLKGLMASLGVETRVQLAYEVALRGWLE